MYDGGSRSDLAEATLPHGAAGGGMQRARGEVVVEWKRRGERTVLARLRQDGCLKARFPRPADDAWAEVVLLNSSGGVAAGDALSVRIEAGAGTHATVAAQAAERFYRALPSSAPATARNAVAVAHGAALEWLPQETILFDGAALDRRLDVALAGDARFLGIESLVFGRAAMGETVTRLHLRDTIRVRRDGRLILHDAVRLDGAAQATLDRRAIGSGGRAAATLVLVAPDAETRLDAVRDALAGTAAEAGASAWDGMLVARLVAPDGASLRRAVLAGLAVVRGGRAMPRVWAC